MILFFFDWWKIKTIEVSMYIAKAYDAPILEECQFYKMNLLACTNAVINYLSPYVLVDWVSLSVREKDLKLTM